MAINFVVPIAMPVIKDVRKARFVALYGKDSILALAAFMKGRFRSWYVLI